MPSPVSKFPAKPEYPPITPRKLTYNEQCAATGGREYRSARMKAARTVEVRRFGGQSGGRAAGTTMRRAAE